MKKKKKSNKLFFQLFIDVLLIAVVLLTFAYFHHVRPTEYSAVVPEQNNSGNETDNTSENNDDWSVKFSDKFLTTEITETLYKSTDINVELTQYFFEKSTIYVEDIYITDINQFRTAFANDTYGRSITQRTKVMSQQHNAIAAINGDSYGLGYHSVVIRNGVLYRQNAHDDICVLYLDGTMKVIPEKTFNAEQEMNNGAWQAWSFGPGLLDDEGKSMDNIYSVVSSTNPRTAIGYYEPGHYCFIVVDGRQGSYSKGLNMDELSDFCEMIGCKVAYNLDGGATSEMIFMGETVNRPSGGGRATSDIIYITEWNYDE